LQKHDYGGEKAMIRKLWQTTSEYVRAGKLADAVKYLESGLAGCEGQIFKSLIDADFTNDPTVIAGSINDLITFCDRSFDVRAIYLEMNGFDINPDRWYFESFAYRKCIDAADELDWLCEWDSPAWPDVTLTGLEQVQADFKRYSMRDGKREPSIGELAEHAVLLVMCKFGQLIERSISEGWVRQIPILATAHDFDIIPRFNIS